MVGLFLFVGQPDSKEKGSIVLAELLLATGAREIGRLAVEERLPHTNDNSAVPKHVFVWREKWSGPRWARCA